MPLLQNTIKPLKNVLLPLRSINYRSKSILSVLGMEKNVRQIGDPVLRERAKEVEKTYLIGQEFKELADLMTSTMRNKKGVGIAAPQVGKSLRIIAVEVNGEHIKRAMDKYGSEGVRKMGMHLFPLQIFINPELRFTDSSTVAFREGCLSVAGYTAVVPRASEIEVKASSPTGASIQMIVNGWTARIFQHEVDHLNGNLFIDSMMYKTLINEKWQEHC